MDFDPTKLGAIERPIDERDFPLGATIVPGVRPTKGNVDLSWITRNVQRQLPFCGPHALSHNRAIQDRYLYNITAQYTPRYTGIIMKDPTSPYYDTYAPDAGTDMRALFKAAKGAGENTFEPLENDTTLPIDQYIAPAAVTDAMKADAVTRLISAYAFDETPGGPTYDSIANAVWQHKGALLLIKCDGGFWGTSTPTFTTPTYGHFVEAYDWDDERGGIYVIDSAEPDPQYALKFIDKKYIVNAFIREAGTTVDLPPSVHEALSAQQVDAAKQILANMQKILELDLEWIKRKVAVPATA